MSSAENSQLTTTSYALLGQLALRDWSSYELAAEARRNLHYFWPRAESRIYSEIKRLARLGLASRRSEPRGRRPRTVYSLTPAGRRALATWLATPARPYSLEFEGLLRTLLAALGDRDHFLAVVQQAGEQAAELALVVRPRIAAEYLAGVAPFQDEVHVRAFVFDFLSEFGLLVNNWAARTAAEVAAWTDMGPSPEKTARALEIIGRAASLRPVGEGRSLSPG